MVVTELLGVVNAVPDPNETLPDAAAYQFKVPALAVALNTTVPASHREAGVVEVTLGVAFTAATTALLGETHVPLTAST